MRGDFFVCTLPDRDGDDERFVLLRLDEIPRGFFFAASAEEWRKALTPLTEEGFRLELTGMGLSSEEESAARTRVFDSGFAPLTSHRTD